MMMDVYCVFSLWSTSTLLVAYINISKVLVCHILISNVVKFYNVGVVPATNMTLLSNHKLWCSGMGNDSTSCNIGLLTFLYPMLYIDQWLHRGI